MRLDLKTFLFSVQRFLIYPKVLFLLLSLSVGCIGCAGIPGLSRSGVPGPALQPTADPAWYKDNETILKAYLETLPNSSIGKVLPGIRLSDGELWLEGYVYLGQGLNIPQGLSVRLAGSPSNPSLLRCMISSKSKLITVFFSSPPHVLYLSECLSSS